MDAFLILLFGMLAVMAIPGLVFLIADQFGPTETHHIGRHDFDQPTSESTHLS